MSRKLYPCPFCGKSAPNLLRHVAVECASVSEAKKGHEKKRSTKTKP